MDKNSQNVGGTQSLRRALSLLRLVARDHAQGARAVDLAEASGLERSTAYRLLAALEEEQLVRKDASTKRFHLGMDAMQVGFAAMSRIPLLDLYRPTLQQIARVSGDTVFMLVQQGDHCICVHREEGPFPVRVFATYVGQVRPVGIGAGGLAILATLPDEQIEAILSRHAAAFEAAGLTPQSVRRIVNRTRRLGYSETLGVITSGVSAIGAMIPLAGEMRAAVSIGAIDSRMKPERRAELGEYLLKALAHPVGSAGLIDPRPVGCAPCRPLRPSGAASNRSAFSVAVPTCSG